MPSPAVPVLTYHGYNVAGVDYSDNDHVALAADLGWLTANGWTIVPLELAVHHLLDQTGHGLPERCVCLTFDDGTDLDWQDVDFGPFGRQRGFYGILEDVHRARPDLPAPHATAFVIASAEARSLMSDGALQPGHGMSDQWWASAESSGLMGIGNHSWDHRHPLVVSATDGGGHFFSVDDKPQALQQVVEAGRYIAGRTGAWPTLFAYPWGQASDYLRREFFPAHIEVHGCRAAFSTEPGHMHAGSERWFLPRYVCGQHWREPSELAVLLQ